ncbi:MAG: PA14 domain-containing protein [Verrucomicrobiota bacterium]|nr:PA14 domain-containing protein [Verrucomicrobiota bacterium]
MKKLTRRLSAFFICRNLSLLPLFIFCFGTLFSAQAGTFSSDFNSGLPVGATNYGNATVAATGGFTNSGVLKLTTAVGGQVGSFVINDLDAGQPIQSFVATFKVLIGGGSAADGFSFNFANDLPDAAFGETGAGTGLTVNFDTFANAGENAPALRVSIGGSVVLPEQLFPLRTGSQFVDVMVKLDPDGTLDVAYNGTVVISNLLASTLVNTPGRFGFGARTGGQFDNHFIDNLTIITKTSAGPFVESAAPLGSIVRPDAALNLILKDFTTQVNTNSIQLTLDGGAVAPTITSDGAGGTTVHYQPSTIFASGSTHSVNITFADNGTPTPTTNTFQYGFTTATYNPLATNLAVPASYANLSAPGFFIRYSQIGDLGSRDIFRAESQLANLLIDGSTGLPYVNLAAPNPTDSSFTYPETNVINYAFPPASAGNFPNDANVPGIPGPTTGNGSSYAMEAVTYLHLSPGFYTLGVNSSDGFKLSVADGADVFAPQEAIFSGVRDAADSTVSFSVGLDGYYPFRLVYFTGDPTYAPAPGTAIPSVEFFNIDSTGNKTLINDTNVIGYVPAFRAAITKPYVRSISPGLGESGVPGNTAITATLVNGSLTVQTNTILLQINGITVTPAISSTNTGVYTVSYQPPGVFPPNSTNQVSLAFTDSGSNRRTNIWSFTVANVMTPIWSIPAVNGTWVTAGSTERGLAYNPKTGHLILVSRAAAPAPAGGLGVAILDSTNGSVIGTMNIGDIATTGVGTFKLSMVGVAADGVIYICNLVVNGTTPFQIYRWANETAAPQLVYSANTIGGASRCGDDFRVRGSGSGTQIIANGNSVVTTSPIFTTTDGTNFTGTALNINGIAANVLRLGIAFGCGNTFYGETTGQPVSYVGFAGVPSTAASLITQYGIYDKNTNQSIGPIGIDLNNQRLIGNQTITPHNINLYDVPSLVPTPVKNFPIDQRNYASQNTSFGTGSVDFTPDGSRVFCLDTGNGIIAFSLAPKLAAPTICSQPQTNFYAPGGLAFVDVGGSGHLPQYQWRKNGVNISGATNRTLDIPNFQVANAGLYSVTISNSLGSVISSNALLDVRMTIDTQPASQVVSVGDTVNFNVAVSGGTAIYGYQWKFNDADLSGATNSTLTINNAQVGNAGSYTVAIRDSVGQILTSQVATLNVIVPGATNGTGTGLTGDYFSNQLKTFISPPTLTRIDPTVDFDFGVGSPDPSISVDTFTIRWSGQVQPRYSQTYTFYTITDDGVRLWVNGSLLIDKWIDQGPTEWSGTIPLSANQKYNIIMEYYENGGGAAAHLSWGSASEVKSIIPMTQLYPTLIPVGPALSARLGGGNLIISWNDPSFFLQSSTNVVGPYMDIPGATSPYTNTVFSDPQRFFRLRN